MSLTIQERIKDLRDVLKEGQVDTALLGELAAHPDFVKLLADIQIYVDGIAAIQIQNLNAWVDVARAEIVEKYQPGDNDRTTYLLQADKTPLQQIDRGRKTVAGPDCAEVGIDESLCFAERKDAEINHGYCFPKNFPQGQYLSTLCAIMNNDQSSSNKRNLSA